jgi:hypothetical protein
LALDPSSTLFLLARFLSFLAGILATWQHWRLSQASYVTKKTFKNNAVPTHFQNILLQILNKIPD